jgi:hypothetical protein
MYGFSQGYIPMTTPSIPVSMPLHYQFSPVNDHRQQELHQLRRSVDMFPVFNMQTNIDTMSVKSRQSQNNRLILRTSNKSNKWFIAAVSWINIIEGWKAETHKWLKTDY